MKKRVLIVIDKLNTGGVTTSLLNLLNLMSDEYLFDLIIFNNNMLDPMLIPRNVNIIQTPKVLSIMGMTQHETKHESTWLYILRLLLVAMSKLINGHVARRVFYKMLPRYKDYDIAISYTHDVGWKQLTTGCNDFVLNNVIANEKIAYVHCDYQRYGGYNAKSEKIYGRFSKIACVSNGCKASFIKCFPSLINQTVVCENFTNIARIIELSQNPVSYADDEITIVTVCRLSEEKGIDRTLAVFKALKSEGVTGIKWVVVGGGDRLEYYREYIQFNDLNKYISFVGEQKNPYQYMKNADFFLLPSLHEAAPMVFGECRVLKVPVISTKTISAKELIEERSLGYVCDNSEDGIYRCIKGIITGKLPKFDICEEVSLAVNDNAHKQFLGILNGSI